MNCNGHESSTFFIALNKHLVEENTHSDPFLNCSRIRITEKNPTHGII